jgi:hypothetical protein
MAKGHISLSISPFWGFMPTHQKTIKNATSMQMKTKFFFFLRFGIFGSLFATTWFVFANQLLFPISESNTFVWANREIFQE